MRTEDWKKSTLQKPKYLQDCDLCGSPVLGPFYWNGRKIAHTECLEKVPPETRGTTESTMNPELSEYMQEVIAILQTQKQAVADLVGVLKARNRLLYASMVLTHGRDAVEKWWTIRDTAQWPEGLQ